MLRYASLVLVCALQPQVEPSAHGEPADEKPAAGGFDHVREMLAKRQGAAMSLEQAQSVDVTTQRKVNDKQAQKIDEIIDGNNKLQASAVIFTNQYNLNLGILSDLKKNFDIANMRLKEWRIDSLKSWQAVKAKMTAVLEETQGKEEAKLKKIGDNLFTTYRAIQSLFGYQVQKYSYIKNKMSELQLAFTAFDKQAETTVYSLAGIISNNAKEANEKLQDRTLQASDFMDGNIQNMYNNLRARMDRNDARIKESNVFMNKVFWDGGAEIAQSPAPAPKIPEKKAWYGFPKWGPALVQKTPSMLEKEGAKQGEEHSMLEKGSGELHVDKKLYGQPGLIGAAARAYNALGDELESRMAPAKLGLDALIEQGEHEGHLDMALQGKFLSNLQHGLEAMIGLRGRRRRGHMVARPPIKIPKLIGVLEGIQKEADTVEEKVLDKTNQLQDKMQDVERLEQNREKDFYLTHNAAQREVEQDARNRMKYLDLHWEGMLSKHLTSLMALESDLFAGVQKVKEENSIQYALSSQVISSNKKLRTRELGELRRQLTQIRRRVEQMLSTVKEAAGGMRVDIAKVNTDMNTNAAGVATEAKSKEKELSAEIKSKFDAFNSEIQRAVVNDVQQGSQYNSQLSTSALNYANDGKGMVEALKKEIIGLESQHESMFAQSEAWVQNFNDGLMTLGNQVHDFMRSSLKDVQTLSSNLELKRQRNADALTTQVTMLGRSVQAALDKIHSTEMKGMDEQYSIEKGAVDKLKGSLERDQMSADTDEAVGSRTMKELTDFISKLGRRHDNKLATANEQLKAIEDHVPAMQQEADRVSKKVAAMGAKIAAKREKIVSLFNANIAEKFGAGMATAQATIGVDAKTGERDLGTAMSELTAKAASAAEGVQGTLKGLQGAQAAFDSKVGKAQATISKLTSQGQQVSANMASSVSSLKRSLAADVEGEAELKASVQDELTAGTQKLKAEADKILSTVSQPAQAEFAQKLEAEEARVKQIVAATEYTFGEKQRLINDVNSKILQQLVAVEQSSEVTTVTMEQVADMQHRTDEAAAAAEAHAAEEAGTAEAAAAAAEESMDEQRLSTEDKLKRQVRAQGQLASKALDKAITKVADDADAAVEAIKQQEHLDEDEKKRRIAKVQAAAQKAIAQMADTEAAAGRSLTAYELITTKWNGNLAAHIDELDDVLQAEDLHRTRTLAHAKTDLSDMSGKFHTTVVDVKDAVTKAVQEGKIVLTAEQMNRLHQMEADAHDRMTVHKAEAQKELRIAELLHDRVSRSGEMSEEEIAQLERKLSLLTGTVSGGVSSLSKRTTDSSMAREKALKAQNHFAAASVGQALSAVSKMAEFLVAATRVSGLKQQALERQQQKLSEVLTSPLASLQEELGMKDSKLAQNEAKMEEDEQHAKEWGDDFGARLMRMQAENNKQLDDAANTVKNMASEVQGQLSDVEAHATQAMSRGTEEIDKMASFDAAKSKHQVSEILSGDEQFEKDLAARAKNTVGLATDQVDKIKFEQYNKFMEMDANDDKLAENIEKLKAKSDSMISNAQQLSARVAAAVNKQLMATEDKRAAAAKELNQLNARANAMAGNDPSLNSASLSEIKDSLLHAKVSDAALEQLANTLEQHNAQEQQRVAQAEQLNAEVRQQLTA